MYKVEALSFHAVVALTKYKVESGLAIESRRRSGADRSEVTWQVCDAKGAWVDIGAKAAALCPGSEASLAQARNVSTSHALPALCFRVVGEARARAGTASRAFSERPRHRPAGGFTSRKSNVDSASSRKANHPPGD